MINEAKEFDNYPWTPEQLMWIKMEEEFMRQELKRLREIRELKL